MQLFSCNLRYVVIYFTNFRSVPSRQHMRYCRYATGNREWPSGIIGRENSPWCTWRRGRASFCLSDSVVPEARNATRRGARRSRRFRNLVCVRYIAMSSRIDIAYLGTRKRCVLLCKVSSFLRPSSKLKINKIWSFCKGIKFSVNRAKKKLMEKILNMSYKMLD